MRNTLEASLRKPASALGVLALLLASTLQSFAPPPLVTGDVPTADQGTFEWYVGGLYQDSGSISRALPFTELVYGLTKRWEVTAETAFLSTQGEHGLGDLVLGTKYVLLPETEQLPGVAVSFDASLPTGDETKGLGSGAPEFDLRVRTQKTFGTFTPILNFGYVILEEPKIGGIRQPREDYVRASAALEWQVAERTKLLTEIYGRGKDEPTGEYRIAAQVGFKHKFSDTLQIHGAVGRSLRDHAKGGPDLRVYLGVRINFDAPWANQ